MEPPIEGLRVREFRAADLPQVEGLVGEATASWGPEWRAHVLRLYSPAFHSDDTRRLVAVMGREVVAALVLRRDVDAIVLYFLAVKAKHRKRGVGSFMVEFAEELAKREGVSLLRVDTAEEIFDNIHFYLRLGFQVGGIVRNLYVPGDSQVFLFKKIRPARARRPGRGQRARPAPRASAPSFPPA